MNSLAILLLVVSVTAMPERDLSGLTPGRPVVGGTAMGIMPAGARFEDDGGEVNPQGTPVLLPAPIPASHVNRAQVDPIPDSAHRPQVEPRPDPAHRPQVEPMPMPTPDDRVQTKPLPRSVAPPAETKPLPRPGAPPVQTKPFQRPTGPQDSE